MIPFLVVDRPASLRVIKGENLSEKIGLMSHANTTPYFRHLFRFYPCEENPCHAIDPLGESCCPNSFNSKFCDIALNLRSNTIKMCDCGMFTKEGVRFTHDQLFRVYEEMNADYGIMIDVLRDCDATINNAKEALKTYSKIDYNFKLVLVAQGNTVEEYIKCYEKMIDLGGEFIAIGGLLRRRANTARFVHVRDTTFMINVLQRIRDEFNPKWIFALGCYHPKRHKLFQRLGIWGSDYKGWIFQYKKRENLIQYHWEEIAGILNNAIGSKCNPLILKLNSLIQERYIQLSLFERSNYKKSPRNLSMADRKPEFIKLDCDLKYNLFLILENSDLNGASQVIDENLREIEKLSLLSDQQVRFNQLRSLVKGLNQSD